MQQISVWSFTSKREHMVRGDTLRDLEDSIDEWKIKVDRVFCTNSRG